MKKIILISILLLVFVTGCSRNEEKDNSVANENVIACTREDIIVDGISLEANYEMTYDGEYVKLLKTKEIVTSSDSNYLSQYKTTIESMYNPYNVLEGYTYEVKEKDGSITSEVTIDYNKIDMERYLKIDPNNEKFMENGQVLLSKLQTIYENIGAVCH